MKILGIDPGTTTVWYALIEKLWQSYELIDFWVIETPANIAQEEKLREIWGDISSLIETHKPERLGIEKLYFNTNITTGIAVSQARWVIIYEAVKHGLEIYEYTPLQIKKAVTGNGKAKKAQLQKAIQIIFWLSEIPKPDDAADGIAIAYITALEK